MNDTELLAVIEDCSRDPAALAQTLPAGAKEVGRELRTNPTCGDRVDLSLHLDGDRVFLRGVITGCALSTAAGVILAEAIDGIPRSVAAEALAQLVDVRLRGGDLRVEASSSGAGSAISAVTTSAEELMGIAHLEVVPLRRRCIAFPWKLASDLLAMEVSAEEVSAETTEEATAVDRSTEGRSTGVG